jgi:hypothetical protein
MDYIAFSELDTHMTIISVKQENGEHYGYCYPTIDFYFDNEKDMIDLFQLFHGNAFQRS